jgi:pimeloyl-ACP methyl ester carboxylesterase
MRLRALTIVAAFVVTGCSNNAATSPTPPALLNLVTVPVTGSSGGALRLQNGDAASFPPGALAGNENVTLSANASETPSLPVSGWAAAPGTMTLKFSAPVGSKPGGTQNQPFVTLTFAYAASHATAILAAQAPIVEVTTSGGKVERFSPDATFDATKNEATAKLLASEINGATSLKMYVAIDGGALTDFPLGPKLWNATTGQWQPEPFTVDPTKKTVLMVHGIFSSVETAFPCESAILKASGYQQAIGLDYDWTQPPATEAPILSQLVNSLPVSSLDLEAHSYGTVVTLAGLPGMKKRINHVVLLGGPLPLNGAPQADPGYLRDLIMLGVFIAEPSTVYAAYKSGMINSMATNSPQLQAIDKGLAALTLPPFVQVAGGSPLPEETENYAVYALYLYLYNGLTNDGIVEQKSAIQSFKTKTSEITMLNLDHIQLECSSEVQQFVGPAVQ